MHRVEVLNWGTFHKQVWGLDLGGNNALLTGDIGSGKSTFVDAVTALLVPRANFNKAAGAATGERSLETYFFGRYKIGARRTRPIVEAGVLARRGQLLGAALPLFQRGAGAARHAGAGLLGQGAARSAGPFVRDRRPAALHQRALCRFRRRHQHAAQAPARHAASGTVRDVPALRLGVPAPLRHRERTGDGSLPPDHLHEVGGQPHRFRARAHAGSLVRRGADSGADRPLSGSRPRP